jgi:hypothetical protein
MSKPEPARKYLATEVQMAGSIDAKKFADHMDITQNPIWAATH